ncbi:MAG: hypothetical protein JKY65_29775 [Planctomycetes bacterium]|nr:hypothetical protein [Planctomycetota bacterium]
MNELDVNTIKAEIKRLALACKARKRSDGGRADPIRYTQLCALRASQRGRLHFAPGTNLCEAHWILGLPCRSSDGYLPVTLAIQEAWVAPLREEFLSTKAERPPERAQAR